MPHADVRADSDTLVLDVAAAQRLVGVMASASTDLLRDQAALDRMLDDATSLLRRDQTEPLHPIRSARVRLDRLTTDLRTRLDLIERTRRDIGEVDRLSLAIGSWADSSTSPIRVVLRRRRRALILTLVGDDQGLAVRVEQAMAEGKGVAVALARIDAEVRLEARVAATAEALDIELAAARVLIERMRRELANLVVSGFGVDESQGALVLVERFGLDLAVAVDRARSSGVGLLDAVGAMLLAGATGVTLAEFDALGGLEENFAVFDNATGGRADGRVSAADLEYVVANRCQFTPSQVVAAQALLDVPELRIRLDTAEENADVIGGERFGRTAPGDGLISESDLKAFLLKSQLQQVLGPYADEIDVAADLSGVVDGFRSQDDFRRFIADNPDLPESVVANAEAMLAAGWFDESWWQEHKDELAMGAALIAGGVVVIATGGTAGILLVAGVGALSAAGTTIAVNLATDDGAFDDVALNGLRGAFVGAGVRSVVVGAGAIGASGSALGRSVAVAGVTGGAADVVSAGGLDLLIPEEQEQAVREVSNTVGLVAAGWEMTIGGGEWVARRMTRFERLDDQLDALSDTISRQKQGRHIDGAAEREDGYGGYFTDPADAQEVLDAVQDGSADILGRTKNGHILVRVDGVEGINVNAGGSNPLQPTDVFIVKGTASPSVVPTSPAATPASPIGTPE
jgi:hypothetical protein